MLVSSSCVKARTVQLLIIQYALWKVLNQVEEWRERRMLGKRMMLTIMLVQIETKELIVFHIYILIPMLACL